MKRFTESLKWNDPWFRRLSGTAKLLWHYFLDHCDNIGLVEIDFELASRDLGLKTTEKTAREFGERVQELGDGRYFMPKFIPFQYGKLSESCPAHKKVIEAVVRHGLIIANGNYRYPTSYPNSRVIVTLQEEDKDRKGIGRGQEEEERPKNSNRGTLEELKAFAVEIGLLDSDGEAAFHKWQGNGWKNGNAAIKCWRSTIRSWKAAGYHPSQKRDVGGKPPGGPHAGIHNPQNVEKGF